MLSRRNPNLGEWDSDRLVGEVAARFVKRFARQNKTDLPNVKLQNHVVCAAVSKNGDRDLKKGFLDSREPPE